MKKATVFTGIKIKKYNGALENVPYLTFEDYLKFHKYSYGCEFVKDEPELFLCAIFYIDNNLSSLCSFREKLNKGIGYSYLLNKQEISKKLKIDGCILAVEGLGEIDSIDDIV